MNRSEGQIDLGKQILDKELLDRRGLRAGKVDDLMLELPDPAGDEPVSSGSLRVAAIITGPMALSRTMPGPVQWLARMIYRILGLADPEPVTIPWENVTEIDVTVHTDIDRDDAGTTAVAEAANRRYIRRLPGA